MKQSEYFDEEILEKVNNKYYTPTVFNNALNEITKKNPLHPHKYILYIFSILSPLTTS